MHSHPIHVCAQHGIVQQQCRCPKTKPYRVMDDQECRHGEPTDSTLYLDSNGDMVRGNLLSETLLPPTPEPDFDPTLSAKDAAVNLIISGIESGRFDTHMERLSIAISKRNLRRSLGMEPEDV